jgi:hypothetical protein
MASKSRSTPGGIPTRPVTSPAQRTGSKVPRPSRRPLWFLIGGLAGAGLGAAILLPRPAGPPPGTELPNPALTAPAIAPTQTAKSRPQFDKDAAWKHLTKQVEFGPRVAGLPGHTACLNWMTGVLTPLADKVEKQEFSGNLIIKRLPMANVIATWKGTGAPAEGILLAAHWDTRPTADEDRDPVKVGKPIPGANDGASGVAVLLELARLLKQNPPPVPVTLVFFDGEDYGPGIDRMFLGSKHFATHLPPGTPHQGALLDMIGDKELVIPKEGYSSQGAPEVQATVYSIAKRLGYAKQFPDEIGSPIMDDHLPLLEQGLKVIDLIDFNYGPNHSWWHTHADTPDKCSAASLKTVGDVMAEWIYTRGG